MRANEEIWKRTKSTYKLVKRVIEGNKVIGYIVNPWDKKELVFVNNELFVDIESMIQALTDNYYIIENVKVTSSGKLRGYNGFHLSKLPILFVLDRKQVEQDLREVLEYVFNLVCDGEKVEGVYSSVYLQRDGKIRCRVKADLKAYSSMKEEDALFKIMDEVKRYRKTLPRNLKGKCDNVWGEIGIKDKLVTITADKSLLREN